jgi:hypothetical protein
MDELENGRRVKTNERRERQQTQALKNSRVADTETFDERHIDEVQSAVDLLIVKGWLTKRGRIPSKEIYGMTKDRIPEIRNFLLSGARF